MTGVGERVRHARIYAGLAQAELAELAHVSQSAISQIEHGGPPAEATIGAIAAATGFAPWFFALGPLPDLPEGSLRFRKRATSRARDDERVRAHVRQAIEVLVRLSADVEPPPVRLTPCADPDVDDARVEALAVETREVLGVGPRDPIPNMVRAVERAGVMVIGSAREIEKHWGASYWPDFPHGRPVICFTRGLPGDSERLTVGHELGHLLLHQLRTVDGPRAEAEGFRFGAALLLPEEQAREEIESPVTLNALARVKARWGISIRALVRRCLDLGLVTAERRTSLEKQISARGWRIHEPVEVAEEQPQLVRRMVEAATGTTKPAALAPVLGLPPLAVNELLG